MELGEENSGLFDADPSLGEEASSEFFPLINPNSSGSFPLSLTLDPSEYDPPPAVPLSAELLLAIFLKLDTKDLKSSALVCRQWHAIVIDTLFRTTRYYNYWLSDLRDNVLSFHLSAGSFPYKITDERLRTISLENVEPRSAKTKSVLALAALSNPTPSDLLAMQVFSLSMLRSSLGFALCADTLFDAAILKDLSEIILQLGDKLRNCVSVHDTGRSQINLMKQLLPRLNKKYLRTIIDPLVVRLDIENTVHSLVVLSPALTEDDKARVTNTLLARMKLCMRVDHPEAFNIHAHLIRIITHILPYWTPAEWKKVLPHLMSLFEIDAFLLDTCLDSALIAALPHISQDTAYYLAKNLSTRFSIRVGNDIADRRNRTMVLSLYPLARENDPLSEAATRVQADIIKLNIKLMSRLNQSQIEEIWCFLVNAISYEGDVKALRSLSNEDCDEYLSSLNLANDFYRIGALVMRYRSIFGLNIGQNLNYFLMSLIRSSSRSAVDDPKLCPKWFVLNYETLLDILSRLEGEEFKDLYDLIYGLIHYLKINDLMEALIAIEKFSQKLSKAQFTQLISLVLIQLVRLKIKNLLTKDQSQRFSSVLTNMLKKANIARSNDHSALIHCAEESVRIHYNGKVFTPEIASFFKALYEIVEYPHLDNIVSIYYDKLLSYCEDLRYALLFFECVLKDLSSLQADLLSRKLLFLLKNDGIREERLRQEVLELIVLILKSHSFDEHIEDLYSYLTTTPDLKIHDLRSALIFFFRQDLPREKRRTLYRAFKSHLMSKSEFVPYYVSLTPHLDNEECDDLYLALIQRDLTIRGFWTLFPRLQPSRKAEYLDLIATELREGRTSSYLMIHLAVIIPHCRDISLEELANRLRVLLLGEFAVEARIILAKLYLLQPPLNVHIDNMSELMCSHPELLGHSKALAQCFSSKLRRELDAQSDSVHKYQVLSLLEKHTQQMQAPNSQWWKPNPSIQKAIVSVNRVPGITLSNENQFELVLCFVDSPRSLGIAQTVYFTILQRLRETRKRKYSEVNNPRVPLDEVNIAACLKVVADAQCLDLESFESLLCCSDSRSLRKTLERPGIESDEIEAIMLSLSLSKDFLLEKSEESKNSTELAGSEPSVKKICTALSETKLF